MTLPALPVLPMGTLMAIAMSSGALALAVSGGPPGAGGEGGGRARVAAFRAVGTVLLISALWQLCWYVPRHATTPWGIAALVSGALLLAAAGALLSPRVAARVLPWSRPLAAGLGAMALLYGVTIARL